MGVEVLAIHPSKCRQQDWYLARLPWYGVGQIHLPQLRGSGMPTGCSSTRIQQYFHSNSPQQRRRQRIRPHHKCECAKLLLQDAVTDFQQYYSIFDEIVQPQIDPNASGGALNDARNVGVSNTELQAVCGSELPGGAFYNDHEGVLINALGYALAVDAIKNGGPGQLSRVDSSKLCNQFAADGLSLPDIFATYGVVPLAAVAVLESPKTMTEPPIKAYAQKDTPA